LSIENIPLSLPFMKKHIPNLLTMTNLFFGCGTIICLIVGEWEKAILFTGVSAVADFFDGWAARKLNVQGPLGVQLDSLADVISFGVVPGMIGYIFLCNALQLPTAPISQFSWFAMPAFMITVFSGLRLGKFNIESSKDGDFIGLNTPSNTLFFIGLLWLYNDNGFIHQLLMNPTILYSLVIVMSLLMVSPLKMFSFKVSNYRFKDNIYRISLLIGIVILTLVFGKAAVSLSIIWYLILSFIQQLLSKNIEQKLESQ